MRNRSAIWVFTILLTLACLYQLSFSWVTKGVEDAAVESANHQYDSIALLGETEVEVGNETYDLSQKADVQNLKTHFEQKYISDHSDEPVYPLLGLTYQRCKDQQLGLGLDLQGGMSVTLDVSIPDLVRNLAGNSSKPSFQEPFNKAFDAYAEGKSEDFVALFDEAYKASEWANQPMTYFNVANKDFFPVEMSNDEIIAKLKELSADAIDKTQRIIEARINKFGVSQPTIQKQALTGRLHIELPGAKDKNRVRKLLQSTASLEFWNAYNGNVRDAFVKLNDILKSEAGVAEAMIEEKRAEFEVLTDSAYSVLDSTARANYDQAKSDYELQLALDSANDVEGDTAAIAAADGPLFSRLVFTQGGSTYPHIGFAKASDTAQISSYLKRPEMKGFVPANVAFMWTAQAERNTNPVTGEEVTAYSLIAIEKELDGKPKISGEDIQEAYQDYNQKGKPAVTLLMKSQAANTWATWTEEKVGYIIAIVLDNQVYSYPSINEKIPNGSTIISGNFTIEEAQDLANILKAGSLPAPAKIVDEAVVGASLGEENIQAGLMSFVIAIILVLIYMVFYYNKAGAVAAIALVANIFFIMGTLASMGAALTLPGIAGLVLTIGMSVDANVLIYERIREEMRMGKGVKLAIADGYKHAYSAIIDANITSLLTAIVLAYFGSGPIQGFATTLIVGIFTSLFSAIFVTRLLFSHMLDKKMSINFSSKMTENIFVNSNRNFLKKRKIFYVISGIVIVAGLGSLFTQGLDGGVEFTGGRTYRVEFSEAPDKSAIANAIEKNSVNADGTEVAPQLKTVNNDLTLEITTKYLYTDKTKEATDKVDAALTAAFGELGFVDESKTEGEKNFNIVEQRSVDAQISKELFTESIWAIIFSLIAIFLYIALRFQRWQWGLGALIAMFHDVLVVLGLFSLLYKFVPFSMEIDQAFIAAILTVVGYSINDTVVVFDRIREYIHFHKREDQEMVVNKALNSTLSRTINTSMTTFVVLLIIFLFGGESIKGFSFALMVGVVVGTYSSIFIATPSVLDITKNIMPVPVDKKKNKK